MKITSKEENVQVANRSLERVIEGGLYRSNLGSFGLGEVKKDGLNSESALNSNSSELPGMLDNPPTKEEIFLI